MKSFSEMLLEKLRVTQNKTSSFDDENSIEVPYYDIPDDSPELGVESVVGGVLSYTLWPIKEKQGESVIPDEYKPLGLYDPS